VIMCCLDDDVAHLKAIHAIRQVLSVFARGADRNDHAFRRWAFWDDADITYGPFQGRPDAFLAWVELYRYDDGRELVGAQHLLGQPLIFVDDLSAVSETPFLATFEFRHDDEELPELEFRGGRYLDQLECRGSEWKIRTRTSVLDWSRRLHGDYVQPGANSSGTWTTGATWAESDNDPAAWFRSAALATMSSTSGSVPPRRST
jgi:hypothetical protein